MPFDAEAEARKVVGEKKVEVSQWAHDIKIDLIKLKLEYAYKQGMLDAAEIANEACFERAEYAAKLIREAAEKELENNEY